MLAKGKPFYKTKAAYLAVAVLLVGTATVFALEATNTTHFFHSSPKPVSGSQYTKGEVPSNSSSSDNQSSSGQSNNSSSQQNQAEDNKSNNSVSGATLVAPSGNFVSNHHPNLSGSPAPSQMTSACTTTPGASCYISFTKDGVTKSLPAQAADRGGSTYWDWRLQDVGLAAGSWQVKAVASLNGKTLETVDALSLEVTP